MTRHASEVFELVKSGQGFGGRIRYIHGTVPSEYIARVVSLFIVQCIQDCKLMNSFDARVSIVESLNIMRAKK